MTWILFADSSNAVSFLPEWDYKEPDKKIENEHRTKGGKLYRYKFSSYSQFRFSVEYVSSADANVVNNWWLNNTELLFMEEGSADVSSVLMMNKEKPLTSRVVPMQDQFKGVIELGTY